MTQQEQLSKDYRNYREQCGITDSIVLDEIEYAFLQGMLRQEESMMKGFCYDTKLYTESDGTEEDGNYEEWLCLEEPEILTLPKKLKLKDGDGVSVILIKK